MKSIRPDEMNLRASDLTLSVSQNIMYAWNMTSCQFEISLKPRTAIGPTLLLCYHRFLRALQQNRAQSRLLYLLTNVHITCALLKAAEKINAKSVFSPRGCSVLCLKIMLASARRRFTVFPNPDWFIETIN